MIHEINGVLHMKKSVEKNFIRSHGHRCRRKPPHVICATRGKNKNIFCLFREWNVIKFFLRAILNKRKKFLFRMTMTTHDGVHTMQCSR